MFAGSTSDGWPSRKLDQRSGFVERGCARCRILDLSVALWFTSHKLVSSLLLLRASALTFLACWVPSGCTGLLSFSRKDTQQTKLCPRHSEALRNRAGAAVASLKMITRTWTNAPQNQCGSSLYAWGFINAQRARLAWVLATRLAGRSINGNGDSLEGSRTDLPVSNDVAGLGPGYRVFVLGSRATDEGALLDAQTSHLFRDA